MARETKYTYYNTGDKLLKRVDLYNQSDVTPYKSIEYTYNEHNQVTKVTMTYDATTVDTIDYTYNTDGTIADVKFTHSVVEVETVLQEDDNEEVNAVV